MSRGGEGGYNGVDAWWTIATADGDGPDADRLVSVHEAFHATLNDCTAFGVALAATGIVSRFGGNDDPLRRLIDMCRTVHESFATFTSLWLVGSGDLALLDGRADYLAWYRDAADLVPLPAGSRRAQIVLDEAARVSMQSGALDAMLLAGFGRHRPEVARADRPDLRFRLLHELSDEAFWADLWRRCVAATEPQDWETIVAADAEPAALALTYTPELAEPCAELGKVVYSAFADLLSRCGARTLGYDDHQPLAVEAIAQVERLHPRARGLLRPALGNDSPTLESFEVWSRERLVVRAAPKRATLHRIEDRPRVGLLSDFRGHFHVFCLVRPAYRLLDQFEFAPHDQDLLAGLQDQPVVAVASVDGDRVDLVVLSRPEHLEAIRTARDDGAVSVMVNVSLACLGVITWRDGWARVLGQTGVTALFDLVPLRQFELWQQERSELRYALVTITGGTAGASMLVCELDGGGLRIVLPCSHVVAEALAEYLDRHYPGSEQDPAVVTDAEELIEATTSHLMTLERSFDVTAYYDAAEARPDAQPRDRARQPLWRRGRGIRR